MANEFLVVETPEDRLRESVTLSESPSLQAQERAKRGPIGAAAQAAAEVPGVVWDEFVGGARQAYDAATAADPTAGIGRRALDVGLGTLRMIFPFAKGAGHVAGATFESVVEGSGELKDEKLRQRLDHARLHAPGEVPLLAHMLSLPYDQRVAAARQGAELAAEVGSSAIPGYGAVSAGIRALTGSTRAAGDVAAMKAATKSLDTGEASRAVQGAGAKFKAASEGPNGETLIWYDVDVPGSVPTTRMMPLDKATPESIAADVAATREAFKPAMTWNREAYEAALKEYRAGERVPNVETRAKGEVLAREQADDLIAGAVPERAMAAEEAYAFVRVEELSGERLKFLAKNVIEAKSETYEQATRAMLEQLDAHLTISVRRQGGQAESGRALQIFNDPTSASVRRVDDLLKSIEAAGPEASPEVLALRILTSRDPAKMLRQASSMGPRALYDGMTEAWYNSILSGTDTHIGNLAEMTARVYLIEPLAKLGPAAIRWLPQKLGMWEKGERFSEAWAFARTVWNPLETAHALRRAGGGFIEKYRGGIDDPGKLDLPRSHVDHQAAGLTEDSAPLSWGTRALSAVWGLTKTPTRLLASEDEFIRIVAGRALIEEHAVRGANEATRGMGDGVGARWSAIYNDLRTSPTPAARAASRDYGKYLALQSDLGSVSKAGQNLIEHIPFLGRAVVPFLRTSVNMGKATWDHIPGTGALSAISKNYRAAWADPIERNVALGRQGMGAVMGGAFAYWAALGNIVGSLEPKGGGAFYRNVGLKKIDEAIGVQPHSFRVPGTDTWIKHERLGLIGRMLSLSADAALVMNMLEDDEQETGDLIAMAIDSAYAGLVMDPTYSHGLREVIAFFLDPSNGVEHLLTWAEKQASSAVPRIVNQARQATDQIVREAEGVVAQIKNRIPGLSANLPPKWDPITGNKVDVAGEWWEIFVNPTRREQPPVEVPAYVAEMYELGMRAPVIQRRMASYADQPLADPLEIPRLMRNEIAHRAHRITLGGQTLQGRLNSAVNSRLYKKATGDEKAEVIRDVFSIYFEAARDMLIEERYFPEFNDALNKSVQRAYDRQRAARQAVR